MFSVQINSSILFWIESDERINHIIEAMKIYVGALQEYGYIVEEVFVGGGVHELDTGYESFAKKYSTFQDTEEKLCEDFKSEEAKLDGTWMTTLNFGTVVVYMKKKEQEGTVEYKNGKIFVECDDSEIEIKEKCQVEIEPFLYKEK